MRNLRLFSKETFELPVNDFSAFCFSKSDIFILSEGKVFNFGEKLVLKSSVSVENVLETADANHEAIGFSYLLEIRSVVITYSHGEIVCLDRKLQPKVVAYVASGIKASEWSPEQDLLVVVTKENSVILTAKCFDPIVEVELHSDQFGAQSFINVGWGKKETQFHGSEGKLAAKKGKDIVKSSSDRGTYKISWRGDGELFVVSCLHPESQVRVLKIFNKECVLQYTSEDTPGLESTLHWRPNGNLIASSQRMPNKYVVCFFEKNGLKHGNFTLDFEKETHVVQLQWNEASNIIAVWSEDCEKHKQIELYTSRNYHWYCKYSVPFCKGDQILSAQWDKGQANMMHIVVRKEGRNVYMKYSWLWTINRSVTDEAFVVVVDHKKLAITKFSKGIIPPPMSTYTINTPQQVNAVFFAPHPSNSFGVFLSDSTLQFYTDTENELGHELLKELKLTTSPLMSCFLWHSNDVIVCQLEENKDTFFLCSMALNIDNNFKKLFRLTLPIATISSYPEKQKVFIQNIEGTPYILNLDDNTFDLRTETQAVYFTNQRVTQFYGNDLKTLVDMQIVKIEGEDYIFGTDSLNRFYVNNRIVANNVTSFTVLDCFLVLTTLKHRLYCLKINPNLTNLFGRELPDDISRKVERGSRIITTIPEKTQVILQLPRGNLETIQPRTLPIHAVGKHLDSLKYDVAFNIMRKQRIDLNLIFDHNPQLFVDNFDKFIKQIQNPSWLNVFISDLNQEDVTKTMYASMYSRNAPPVTSKIFLVCDLFTNSDVTKYSEHCVLPIITAYLKKGRVPDFEQALLILKDIQKKEAKKEKIPVSSVECIKYLTCLIDVENLYNIALGMYDFDLVLLIAAISQKDPKEYISFLNDLRKFDTYYQRFMINKRLKRFESALDNLIQSDDPQHFVECLQFIKLHRLYKEALAICVKPEQYKKISFAYGEYLLESNKFEEAGIMFSRAEEYQKSLEAFKKCNNWREVISCSRKLKYNPTEIKQLYISVIKELKEVKLYRECSIIYIEYLELIEDGIIALCEGRIWVEALRLVELYSKQELLENLVKPAVQNHCSSLITQIIENTELFALRKKRLRVVREAQEKKELELEGLGSDDDSLTESSANVSYSSLTSSNYETVSGARRRRKHERKLLSLREGSKFEDLALITALHQIALNGLQLQSEVKQLLYVLLKLGFDEDAKKLQTVFGKFSTLLEDGKHEIWNENLCAGNKPTPFGPDSTSNSIAISKLAREQTTKNLLEPRFRFPPYIPLQPQWESDILK